MNEPLHLGRCLLAIAERAPNATFTITEDETVRISWNDREAEFTVEECAADYEAVTKRVLGAISQYRPMQNYTFRYQPFQARQVTQSLGKAITVLLSWFPGIQFHWDRRHFGIMLHEDSESPELKEQLQEATKELTEVLQ